MLCSFIILIIFSASPYSPVSGNSISSPINTSNDGSFRPPPPSMRVADNHRSGSLYPPTQQQHSQSQLQQQLSPPNQQHYHPQGPSNMNTPIRSHHHPPAVHQMYSSNGDAYAVKTNQHPQQMLPHQNKQQLYSPNIQQVPQNHVEGGPLPGGRQPLYANAPPKPRRLNSSSGIEDEATSPDTRPTGGQRDTDTPDDDGGFAEYTGYQHGNRRSKPAMATATYHHPRGANQAKVVDDTGIVFHNQVEGTIYEQQIPNLQQNQSQHRHR